MERHHVCCAVSRTSSSNRRMTRTTLPCRAAARARAPGRRCPARTMLPLRQARVRARAPERCCPARRMTRATVPCRVAAPGARARTRVFGLLRHPRAGRFVDCIRARTDLAKSKAARNKSQMSVSEDTAMSSPPGETCNGAAPNPVRSEPPTLKIGSKSRRNHTR